jgi:hypothetical protein
MAFRIRNQMSWIRSVSGGFAAGEKERNTDRFSSVSRLLSGIRNQMSGIRSVSGGFAAGEKERNTDRFSSVSRLLTSVP